MPDNGIEAHQHSVTLRINGVEHAIAIEARMSLLDVLREIIGLPGTKKGCNQGACGACTVIADGRRINSCLALALQFEDAEITTIEGLDAGGLHPLQAAFIEHDGFQCGYCTPGQICSAVAMANEYRDGMPSAVTPPASLARFTDDEVRERMSGNLCRCGAYRGILDAIHEAYDAEFAP